MPHPRGSRVVTFPTSTRAVVREAEWKVMSERIASELKPLVKLAKDQGWTISGTDKGKLVWRGPNGEGPVYTGYRCQGRDLMNYRAELIRNGLKLDEHTARDHVREETAVQLLDAGSNASLEEIQNAMSLVSASVATMIVKAEEFDTAKASADEWEKLAEEALAEANKAKESLVQIETTLMAVRQCFELAPWAILPEIAKLLGINAGGPSGGSLATQAVQTNATAPGGRQ